VATIREVKTDEYHKIHQSCEEVEGNLLEQYVSLVDQVPREDSLSIVVKDFIAVHVSVL